MGVTWYLIVVQRVPFRMFLYSLKSNSARTFLLELSAAIVYFHFHLRIVCFGPLRFQFDLEHLRIG